MCYTAVKATLRAKLLQQQPDILNCCYSNLTHWTAVTTTLRAILLQQQPDALYRCNSNLTRYTAVTATWCDIPLPLHPDALYHCHSILMGYTAVTATWHAVPLPPHSEVLNHCHCNLTLCILYHLAEFYCSYFLLNDLSFKKNNYNLFGRRKVKLTQAIVCIQYGGSKIHISVFLHV